MIIDNQRDKVQEVSIQALLEAMRKNERLVADLVCVAKT